MTVEIPSGYMHVIQPFRLVTATKDWTTTYALTTSSPQVALTEADDNFRDAWSPLTDTNFNMLPAVGYYRNAGGDLELYESTLAATPGASGKVSAPPNCTIVISKRTAFVGRKHRGRCFLPIGVTEGQVDESGVLSAAFVLDLQQRANAWLGSMNSAIDFTGMWLLHSDISDAPSRVTSLATQPVVRTQRRRLP
jgi:hypothetical protein